MNNGKNTLKDKIAAWITHNPKQTLWIIFMVGFLVRLYFAVFLKHVWCYFDELSYYNVAENLAHGNGFPVVYPGTSFNSQRILYSILIAPAFLVPNREVQQYFIAFINTFILISGSIPVYKLSKYVTNKDKQSLFAAFMYVCLPDMAYNITFMSDIVMLPISLWIIYLSQYIISWKHLSGKSKIKYSIILFLTCMIATFAKIAAFLFIPILILTMITNKNFKDKKKLFRSIIATIIFILLLFVLFLYLKDKIDILSHLYSGCKEILNSFSRSGNLVFIKMYLYTLMNIVLAFGIFPALFPYMFYRVLNHKEKVLLKYMTITVLLFLIGVTYGEVGTGSMTGNFHPAMLRYVIFIWMPYFILFFDIIRKKASALKIRRIRPYVFLLVISICVIVFYRGVQVDSQIEQTLLYWAFGWGANRFKYSVWFAIIVTVLTFLFIRKRRLFFAGFAIIYGSLQIYNNVAAVTTLKSLYAMPTTGVDKIEGFIRDHKNKKFLIVEYGNDIMDIPWYGRYVRSLGTYAADTYLNYSNTLRCSMRHLNYIQGDGEIDLNNYQLPVYFGKSLSNEAFYKKQDIDYMVIPNDLHCTPNSKMCKLEDVGNGDLFHIYKLNDNTKLPRLVSNFCLPQGKTIINVNNDMFSSDIREKDGSYSFSSNEGLGHLNYGPSNLLWPGKYIVTIHYSYRGDIPAGTSIGYAYLFGSNKDMSNYKCDVKSGEKAVSFNFEVSETIETFQARLVATQPGITVENIEFDFQPYY